MVEKQKHELQKLSSNPQNKKLYSLLLFQRIKNHGNQKTDSIESYLILVNLMIPLEKTKRATYQIGSENRVRKSLLEKNEKNPSSSGEKKLRNLREASQKIKSGIIKIPKKPSSTILRNQARILKKSNQIGENARNSQRRNSQKKKNQPWAEDLKRVIQDTRELGMRGIRNSLRSSQPENGISNERKK